VKVYPAPLAAFLYILFRPVSNGSILLSILVGLAVLGLAAGIAGGHRIATPLLQLFGIQLLFGITFGLVGVGNPGLPDQLLTFLGFPVVFWLMIYGISEVILGRIMWTLAIGCTAVALTIISYVGSQQGVLPQIIPTHFLQAQTGAVFANARIGNQTAIQFYGLATLAAGAPLLVASLLVPNARLLPSRRMCLIAAVTCTVAALVAGRRAIVITTMLAPALLWIASKVIGRARADRSVLSPRELAVVRRRRWGLVGAMVVGVLGVGNLSLGSSTVTGSTVSKAFNALTSTFLGGSATGDSDALIRRDEARILLGGFRAHPILGNGFGATVPGYQRNPKKPWDFELQYHMLLFDTGLLGVLLALAAAGVLIHAARRAVQARPDLAGCLAVAAVGCLALLAAATSNPYLQAPGYNWALYLPLAVINVALAPGGGRSPVHSRASASTSVPRRTPASSVTNSPTTTVFS